MKATRLIGVTALCVGLFGCGGGDDRAPMTSAPPPPPPPASVTFSVHDVLALAQSPSDTNDPQAVNGGDGGSITGSDETSDPMAVE